MQTLYHSSCSAPRHSSLPSSASGVSAWPVAPVSLSRRPYQVSRASTRCQLSQHRSFSTSAQTPVLVGTRMCWLGLLRTPGASRSSTTQALKHVGVCLGPIAIFVSDACEHGAAMQCTLLQIAIACPTVTYLFRTCFVAPPPSRRFFLVPPAVPRARACPVRAVRRCVTRLASLLVPPAVPRAPVLVLCVRCAAFSCILLLPLSPPPWVSLSLSLSPARACRALY